MSQVTALRARADERAGNGDRIGRSLDDMARRLTGTPLVRECPHRIARRGDRFCGDCGGRLVWQ